MRPFTLSLVALLSTTAPAALWADTIEASSRVTAVTLYPWGANVTRLVDLTAPAGVHDLIIPDLPQGTDPAHLRVVGEGVAIGAVTLIEGRPPATGDLTPPAIAAARAEVERLEIALATAEAGVAAIRLRARAAEERIAFLRGLAPDTATPEDLRALARMVGDEALVASREALDAEQEALAADRALVPEREALDKARQALAALIDETAGRATLRASVEGAGRISITTFTPDASWQPTYDLRLDRDANRLSLDRGVFVTQASGEDWRGVDLTLSTARPSDRADPTPLWPWLRRIGPPDAPSPRTMAAPQAKYAEGLATDMMVGAVAPVPETAGLAMMGATVTYRYPAPVDIRDGVEALRLRLDDLDFTPEVVAEAVPSRDATAYLVAETVNDSGQVLLPGPATLFVDGAMVGQSHLPLTAAGDDLRLGFGAIDGIVLERRVPDRTEGDRGVITRSNELTERAVLTIRNLTDQDWPVRVIDQVPYSEQEDLVIRHTARPAASETDLDGGRGILAWDVALAAGETQEITLETTLTWPEGQVLH
ncbi:DUF4139 domain-containing protein [Pontitalea aquivivens]|uniref:DUF4139 domain-containing protein n=1 Tax=Pontitalea aquivivens TaxID=3388663 RepID=UPI0039710805